MPGCAPRRGYFPACFPRPTQGKRKSAKPTAMNPDPAGQREPDGRAGAPWAADSRPVSDRKSSPCPEDSRAEAQTVKKGRRPQKQHKFGGKNYKVPLSSPYLSKILLAPAGPTLLLSASCASYRIDIRLQRRTPCPCSLPDSLQACQKHSFLTRSKGRMLYASGLSYCLPGGHTRPETGAQREPETVSVEVPGVTLHMPVAGFCV